MFFGPSEAMIISQSVGVLLGIILNVIVPIVFPSIYASWSRYLLHLVFILGMASYLSYRSCQYLYLREIRLPYLDMLRRRMPLNFVEHWERARGDGACFVCGEKKTKAT